MGRAKISEEQIITAGEALELANPGESISGWQIEQLINDGGNTKRMKLVWEAHLAARDAPVLAPEVVGIEDKGLAVLLHNVAQQTEAYVRADRAAREKKHADILRVLICEKDDQLARAQADRAQVEQMLGDRDDERDHLQDRLDERDVQIETLTLAVAGLENDLAESAEVLALVQQRLVMSEAEAASAREREASLRAQLDARKAETAAVTAEARAHAARADHAETHVASLTRDIHVLEAAQEALEDAARDCELNAETQRQRADASDARAAALGQQVADLTARAVAAAEAEKVAAQQPKAQKKASRNRMPKADPAGAVPDAAPADGSRIAVNLDRLAAASPDS